jgi:chemotaxis protein methyltransferase WspC
MHRIEALLRQVIGLDAASIGSSLIDRIIRLRMKSQGLKQPEDYWKLLNTSRAELNELIEAVVVTETWFFRDREPFAAFAKLVAGEWLPRHPGTELRVLSVPCSSGEEPYSLAMSLLDARMPADLFVIDAVDISTHALARAQAGLYGKNSFRGKDLEFRDRHFKRSKEGYALNANVRTCVRFHHDNVLGHDFLARHTPYDFIFCRNLLIYFDRATQIQALGKLHRLLVPDGVLFVGPAEVPLVIDNGFVNANLSMAFACRKINTPAVARSEPRPPAPASPRSESLSLKSPDFRRETLDFRPKEPAAARRTTLDSRHETQDSGLDVAQQLADAGRLDDAAELCEAHLARHGTSAQAFYLLGLMKDAIGDPEAITFYRKALYLEPNHYEALIHMALLLEKRGDAEGARTLKRRAERAQPKP